LYFGTKQLLSLAGNWVGVNVTDCEHVPRVLAGMLAEQLGNLQDAEEHYEQHLTLADLQPAPDGHGPEWVAAYANVMKVYMAPTLAFQQPGVIIIGIFAFV